jgi:acylglycerol lipase
VRHEDGTFAGSGGVRLYRQSWRPDAGTAEVGAVVLIHGYAEHSGRYAHVAEALVRDGWATFAFDLRGHGRSEGRRAVTEGLDLLLADVDHVVDEATSTLGGRKPVLLGHSMGGGIAAAYALSSPPGGGEGQAKLTALVLSGPALDVGGALSAPQRLGARVVSAVAPAVGVTRLPASAVSRDPAVVEAYERDPLVYHGKVPARTGREMLRASDLVDAKAGELRVPLLILHGSADQLVPVSGSRSLLRDAGSPDKTLKVYDGLYHEVFNEPEQDKVLAELVGWLDEHRPAPA